MSRNVILIAAIVVIAGYFYIKSSEQQDRIIESEISKQESTEMKAQESNESQDEFLIQNLIDEGIIDKINEDGNAPEVYITAQYQRIPNVDKKAMMQVLYKEFTSKNPEVTSFTILDAKSGDVIGTYDGKKFNRSN